MNDDLPPLLADLLDDETPQDRRRSAEATAASDPAIAEEFRSLSAVRDLVAGLSRPAPSDVSAAVLRRIGERRRVRRFARAAAASTLIAAGLGGLLAVRSRDARPLVDRRPTPIMIARAPESSPRPAADPAPVAPPPATAETTPERVGPPDERPLIARRLLERPGPYRMFLAPASRAVDAEEIAALVGLSSHRDFHRFDLPAGEGRLGASVFAAELDPGELRTLRMRLAEAMPDGFDEQETGAVMLADVTRAGTATTFRGDPAAEIVVPQQRLAIRLSPDAPAPPGAPAPAVAVAPDSPPPTDEGPSVILIWLPRSGG